MSKTNLTPEILDEGRRLWDAQTVDDLFSRYPPLTAWLQKHAEALIEAAAERDRFRAALVKLDQHFIPADLASPSSRASMPF